MNAVTRLVAPKRPRTPFLGSSSNLLCAVCLFPLGTAAAAAHPRLVRSAAAFSGQTIVVRFLWTNAAVGCLHFCFPFAVQFRLAGQMQRSHLLQRPHRRMLSSLQNMNSFDIKLKHHYFFFPCASARCLVSEYASLSETKLGYAVLMQHGASTKTGSVPLFIGLTSIILLPP